MIKENLTVWLIAALFIGLGFGVTVLNWQMIYSEGDYFPTMAFFGPFMGFLGLAMLLSPPAKPEGLRESAAAARRRSARLRLAIATMALGLIAAGVNLALMSGWIGGVAG